MAHTANDDASMCREIEQPIPTARGKAMLGLIDAAIARTPGAPIQPADDGEPNEASLVNVGTEDAPHYVLYFPRYAILIDIRFRMLQYYELAGAMSFPSTYIFTGTRQDKVKQIGNASLSNRGGTSARERFYRKSRKHFNDFGFGFRINSIFNMSFLNALVSGASSRFSSSELAGENIRNGSAGKTEMLGDFTLLQIRIVLSHLLNLRIFLGGFFKPLEVSLAMLDGTVGFLRFEGQERAHHPQNSDDFRAGSHTPMIFVFPILLLKSYFVYLTGGGSFINRLDDFSIRIGNADFYAGRFRNINAALAIEKTGEPSAELFVSKSLKHNFSAVFRILRAGNYNAFTVPVETAKALTRAALLGLARRRVEYLPPAASIALT